MALAVNGPDIRTFMAWIESADWIPCIYAPFLCKGNVQHFICHVYSELDATNCAQLVLKDDLEIVP